MTLDRNTGHCIGRGYNNDGCGYVGGTSGDVCPEYGGMVLSQVEIEEADNLAAIIEKQDQERQDEKLKKK
jgi:hypothetical protein